MGSFNLIRSLRAASRQMVTKCCCSQAVHQAGHPTSTWNLQVCDVRGQHAHSYKGRPLVTEPDLAYGVCTPADTAAARLPPMPLLSLPCQVLRLTVEATGMARRLCAPREVIVERLFKR